TRQVTRGGRDVKLTHLEFELLAHFLQNPTRVFAREDLLREVWGLAKASRRTVDNFVAQLRSKLERDPEAPRHLVTVRGSGYRFDPGRASAGWPVDQRDPGAREACSRATRSGPAGASESNDDETTRLSPPGAGRARRRARQAQERRRPAELAPAAARPARPPPAPSPLPLPPP